MRGYAALDRKSLKLVWNDTAEYAYLAAIGHPDPAPESNYEGVVQCTAESR